MSVMATITLLEQEYSRKFDNLDQIEHASFFDAPQFSALLQKAIDRNAPLTRQEVEEVFGDPGWEW